MIQSIKVNRTSSCPVGKTTKLNRTKRTTLEGTLRTKSLKIPSEDSTAESSKKRRTKMKTVVAVPNANSTGGAANMIGTMATTATAGPGITVLPKTEVNIDGNGLQFQSPNNDGSCVGGGNSNKRPASLDLNKPKKQRLMAPSPLVLESPDLQAIKTLNTPDLEKILLSSNLLQTPQPGPVYPTKVGTVTSEQEAFGKGFEEALHSLYNNSKNAQAQIGHTNNNNNNNHNSNTSINNSSVTVTAVPNAPNNAPSTTAGTGMSGGSFIYTNLESNFPISIKDEPQNGPASPPVSPIDMETQEKIKLERKRQRNRVAASKCRKRKLERISKLEDKVKILKSENIDLGLVVKNLKEHVAQLKQQVIDHIEIGCSIPTIYNGQALLQGK